MKNYNTRSSLSKAPIVFLSIVFVIMALIIAVVASLLITKHIYVNRTYPETIKSTDIPAGSIWEYEEDERKLIFYSYQSGHILELKTNTESIYYEFGILPDAGKYKYSMHISEALDDNEKHTEKCEAYCYKDSIKLEFDKGTPNVFGFSSNEIVLKKVSARGEYVSDQSLNCIEKIYNKKVFLSQNSKIGIYKLELENDLDEKKPVSVAKLEGVFENSDGKEEWFYLFALYSNGNISTVALRNINTFLYPPFTEEPLDEHTFAICDFIDSGDSVTVKIQKSNSSSFKEGDVFVMETVPIKEYLYSDFSKTIKNAQTDEILDILKDISNQN